jgi:hypothetical protein
MRYGKDHNKPGRFISLVCQQLRELVAMENKDVAGIDGPSRIGARPLGDVALIVVTELNRSGLPDL